jgi:hypothetical protein
MSIQRDCARLRPISTRAPRGAYLTRRKLETQEHAVSHAAASCPMNSIL